MHLCTVQEKKWLSGIPKVPGFVLDAGDQRYKVPSLQTGGREWYGNSVLRTLTGVLFRKLWGFRD